VNAAIKRMFIATPRALSSDRPGRPDLSVPTGRTHLAALSSSREIGRDCLADEGGARLLAASAEFGQLLEMPVRQIDKDAQ